MVDHESDEAIVTSPAVESPLEIAVESSDDIDIENASSSASEKDVRFTSDTHYADEGNDLRQIPAKIMLKEKDCFNELGFMFPTLKQWSILTVVFLVQVSMNFNTSIYASAISQVSERYNVSYQAARVGQMIYLIMYGIGSELWAPWSEELGRWPVLQLSLFLVNIWQIPAALSPTFGGLVVARGLGGLSSAGGSVTLGMVADMWDADDQQYAVAYVVLSSVTGTVIGPLVGGFQAQYLGLKWNFWLQLILGGFVQLCHFFTPETNPQTLIDRAAKRRRKAGQTNIYGPGELKEQRFSAKEILITWSRPFEMFFREPIVLSLSLLSGFSDALIFTFLEAFGPVYEQYHFYSYQLGLAYIPLLVGYLLAYFSFFPFIHRDRVFRRRFRDTLQPESRLYWLLYLAPLEAIGLFGFAWTSLGPDYVPWIAPMIFSALVAIANYAIYMATIDYMVAAYGSYAASATGGNALARDLLAGIAAMYSAPFYENVGDRFRLQWPSTILGCIAIIVTIPIYVFYWHGEWFREKSKFAQTLVGGQKDRRDSSVHSRAQSRAASRVASRVNSRVPSRMNSRMNSYMSVRVPSAAKVPTLASRVNSASRVPTLARGASAPTIPTLGLRGFTLSKVPTLDANLEDEKEE